MVSRTIAYIVFGVGILLILAAAVLKVPIGMGPGGALAFLGLALFGLSFIPVARPLEDSPAPMSFPAKLAGIFFEPSSVFRNLRAHPRWLAALILMSLLAFAYSTAFTQRLTPERIVNFTTDKVAEQFKLPPERVAEMKDQQIADAKAPGKVAGNAVTTFAGAFVIYCLIGGLCMLLVLLFGGRLGFWQALSVAVWAGLPPAIIGRVLSLVLLYLKDPDDIHPVLGQGGLVTDNLGALVKPGEHPILFALLSAFGVLAFYHLWLTATGLRNASERLSKGSAWTIALLFWGIGLLFAVASGALFGGFIS
ncbi:MAG TPA: YIP1 family protein [Pyrinomonadaceae bacterium]